jgi:hypothetical protein
MLFHQSNYIYFNWPLFIDNNEIPYNVSIIHPKNRPFLNEGLPIILNYEIFMDCRFNPSMPQNCWWNEKTN